ncbi:hypothetical protein, partial [Escherichia coli]|uniref:hypothetical protein n=1 Tax=Escherichia coli TaxID=562 RepID=UPI001954FFED
AMVIQVRYEFAREKSFLSLASLGASQARGFLLPRDMQMSRTMIWVALIEIGLGVLYLLQGHGLIRF